MLLQRRCCRGARTPGRTDHQSVIRRDLRQQCTKTVRRRTIKRAVRAACATHQHRDARCGQGLKQMCELSPGFSEPLRCDAVRTADDGKDVRTGEPVMFGGNHQTEMLRCNARILALYREGASPARPPYGARERDALSSAGDEHPWPWRCQPVAGFRCMREHRTHSAWRKPAPGPLELTTKHAQWKRQPISKP